MKIEHHPDDFILAAFAAGTLDLGEHVAIATHLVGCAKCRRFVRRMEGVGGAVLTNLAPTPMAAGALEQLEMRLADTSEPEGAQPIPPTISDAGVPGLPGFVQKYRIGRLAVGRAARPSAPHRTAGAEQDPHLSTAFRPRNQNAAAFPHRLGDDLCPVGSIRA